MEPWVLIPITAVFAVSMLLARNELVRRALTCPLKHAEAEVDVVQRYDEPAKPIRVRACSLLPDSKRIACPQTCIHQVA
jgi:hypothetical protein